MRRISIEVIPNCYTRLFAKLSKETPVAGLLQVTKRASSHSNELFSGSN
jgi:hypothetical protein